MWNRTKRVLITIILVTAFLTLCFSTFQRTARAYPPSPPIAGKEVSLNQAQAMAPFKIGLSTTLGDPVEIRAMQNEVIIIYAAQKPSDNATVADVLNQNGVILFEFANPSGLEMSQNILAAIKATDSAMVDINGYVGCAGGNLVHCVAWYTETTEYDLRASLSYPLQQLVQTAQSISIHGQWVRTDLNMDGKVDIQDIGIAAVAFGSKPDDSNWNPVPDVNNDGMVNIIDISIIAKDYGHTTAK